MLSIETAIRLTVIGQELLIAVLFLFSSGRLAGRVSGALFLTSVAGYLYTSDVLLRTSIPAIQPAVLLLALIVPFCLWLFARAIFEHQWPSKWIIATFVIVATAVWIVFVFADDFAAGWVREASVLMHIVSLITVIHALWMTLRGRPDDLVERRRQFRVYFVCIVAVQALAVLVVELAVGGSTTPAWLDLGNVLIIAALTLGLAIPLLRLNPDFFPPQGRIAATDVPRPEPGIGRADEFLRQNLLAAMDNGYYRETGLTIRQLADKLSAPEHQLRRLINSHLGFRNFAAFLSSYRIQEATEQLLKPERARIPVLTIALEMGYASLGPFNRAFKVTTGMTPTQYRQQRPKTVADSE